MVKEKRKMYLAITDGQYIGVFSTREKAEAVQPDEIREIEAVAWEGTPIAEGRVFSASGTQYSSEYVDGAYVEHYTKIDPMWGLNPQSALVEVAGNDETRKKGMLFGSLLAFAVDRVYEAGKVPDITTAGPFGHLYSRVSESSLSDRELAADYVSEYFEEKRRQKEQWNREHSADINTLYQAVMKADIEAYGRMIGREMRKLNGDWEERRFRRRLLQDFKPQELYLLAEGIRQGKGVFGRIDEGEFEGLNQRFEMFLEEMFCRFRIHRR